MFENSQVRYAADGRDEIDDELQHVDLPSTQFDETTGKLVSESRTSRQWSNCDNNVNQMENLTLRQGPVLIRSETEGVGIGGIQVGLQNFNHSIDGAEPHLPIVDPTRISSQVLIHTPTLAKPTIRPSSPCRDRMKIARETPEFSMRLTMIVVREIAVHKLPMEPSVLAAESLTGGQ